MSKFIVNDQEKVDALQERLSSTLYQSVERFVELFNSGIITKDNEEHKSISDEITKIFKNIRKSRGHLLFISEEEILAAEALEKLTPWVTLAKTKRALEQAVNENIIDESDEVLLDDNGNLYVEKIGKDENIEKQYFESDRLVKAEFPHLKLVSNDNGQVFVSNITNLDTSFIKETYNLIPRI